MAVRTGDAGAAERKRLIAEPPSLLLTTPESLAIMLCQEPLRNSLAQVRHVIVDEVHALARRTNAAPILA